MRREQIDMWIVVCREHNEDPVYRTVVPQPSMFAWRLTMFVYTDRGAEIEKLDGQPDTAAATCTRTSRSSTGPRGNRRTSTRGRAWRRSCANATPAHRHQRVARLRVLPMG